MRSHVLALFKSEYRIRLLRPATYTSARRNSLIAGGAMENETRQLVDSMLRLYGKAKAFTLADRYAHDCTVNGDHHGHEKWAAAAAVIGDLIDQDQRFGKQREV
jgi:hypothetical protein